MIVLKAGSTFDIIFKDLFFLFIMSNSALLYSLYVIVHTLHAVSALNAYCLLEVYEVMCTHVRDRQLTVDLGLRMGQTTQPRLTRNERKQLRVTDRSKLAPGADKDLMKNQTVSI